MQRVVFVGCLLVLAGCGPSLGSDRVKTPEEQLAEQEQLGAEQTKQSKQNEGSYDDSGAKTEEEQKRGWDAKQADLELHRASHSAETCPESITEKTSKGRAPLTIVFANDGHVKEATLGSPYAEDSAIGKCVLRAIRAMIVPAYEGPQQT